MSEENRIAAGQPAAGQPAKTCDGDPPPQQDPRGGGDDKARALGGKPSPGGDGRENKNENLGD